MQKDYGYDKYASLYHQAYITKSIILFHSGFVILCLELTEGDEYTLYAEDLIFTSSLYVKEIVLLIYRSFVKPSRA